VNDAAAIGLFACETSRDGVVAQVVRGGASVLAPAGLRAGWLFHARPWPGSGGNTLRCGSSTAPAVLLLSTESSARRAGARVAWGRYLALAAAVLPFLLALLV